MQPFGLVNEETQKTDNQSILFNNVPIWLLAYCVCGVQTSCVWLFFFFIQGLCYTVPFMLEGGVSCREESHMADIYFININTFLICYMVSWFFKVSHLSFRAFFFFSKRWPPVGFMNTGTIYRNISMAVVDGVIQPKKAHSLWGH